MKYLLVASLLLASCSAESSPSPVVKDDQQELAAAPATSPVETALFNQIACRRPPEAGVAMTGLLRRHLIAETKDGGDGIVLFVPVQPLNLLGFPVIRLGGWQAAPDGGAMPPFSRGPGTAPPNFITVTVRAEVADVRAKLAQIGLSESTYVPDHSQNAWTDSEGKVIQPQRKVPGPEIKEGDNDLASHPVPGSTTIECAADDLDFSKEAEAQFGS